MKHLVQLCCVMLATLLLANPVWAEQKKTFGDYEVHYMALTTTDLSPEVAKQYGIRRSNSVGYVNISILKKDKSRAVNADVSGDMANLIGQHKNLSFKRVQEGKAVYYFSTFSFDEKEDYRFKINIEPEGGAKDIQLSFKQAFYSNN